MSRLLLLLSIIPAASAFDWHVFSQYNHFQKRLSPALYAGGLITERQIEGLAEAGFKSIISIAYEGHSIAEYNSIIGPFPSSEEEINIAKQLGMEAVQYNASYTMLSLSAVSKGIIQMPKPVYIHCHAGYAASLFAVLHEYLAATVSGDDIYSNGLTLGWDFQADASAVQFINTVTDSDTSVVSPSIDTTLADGEESYKQYFWSHRITDDWYNIGQVLDTQVGSIATAGYKTVISFRNDGEGTLRLPTDPAEGAVDNNEFSDANGNYAVDLERAAFEKAGLNFYNLPVTGESAWTIGQLDEFTAAMDEAPKPILAHCASGYRSSGYVIAYLGRQQKQCTHWALKEARRIGYSLDQSEDNADVVTFFQEALQC